MTETKINNKKKENMKYIKQLVAALVATALATSVSLASTDTVAKSDERAPWALTLAGGGTTSTSGDGSSVGAEIGIGHTGNFILPLEAGLRQSIGYVSKSSDVNLGTKVYSDWTLVKFWNIELAAGGNVGVNYGNTSLKWVAGPEVVAKLWLTQDVAAFVRTEYQFDLASRKSDDQIAYTLGLSVAF